MSVATTETSSATGGAPRARRRIGVGVILFAAVVVNNYIRKRAEGARR